jgi:hypothetical protein
VIHPLVFCLSAVLLLCCTPSEVNENVDVLVIGGTTGGVAAGIQSARAGAKTLIIEETPWLGGMLTAAGVSAVDGNHHLPSGIWNEFRELLRKHYGGSAALATGWVSNTLFEPHVGDSIFKAMAAREPKLTALYGYYPVSVQKSGNTVRGATFRNSEGETLRIEAKITIDATDLGDGLAMAGAAYRLGMDAKADTGEDLALSRANDVVQDLTCVAILKDYGKNADVSIDKPASYNSEIFAGCCETTVDGTAIDCDRMLSYARLPNNKFMINWPRKGNDIYLNVVEMTREQRIETLKRAREHTLNFVYYIQHELGYRHLGLADDEFSTPDRLAYIPYHREGRRLNGMVRLTYNHLVSPYEQPDPLYRTGISVGDYPVDHHHKCNHSVPELSFLPIPSFCVPLGALIPETIDGLIVADKAISASNLVNGATRLQPVVLLTGQAAGTLAALCVAENKNPREIPVRTVQQKLLDARAYIMPLYDVKPDDADFESIQKITAAGILKTKGEPFHWANRTWFYPDSTLTVGELCSGLRDCGYVTDASKNAGGEILTASKCLEILRTLNGTSAHAVENAGNRVLERSPETPLSKRDVAVIIDKVLNPFDKFIDHRGKYVQNETNNR